MSKVKRASREGWLNRRARMLERHTPGQQAFEGPTSPVDDDTMSFRRRRAHSTSPAPCPAVVPLTYPHCTLYAPCKAVPVAAAKARRTCELHHDYHHDQEQVEVRLGGHPRLKELVA